MPTQTDWEKCMSFIKHDYVHPEHALLDILFVVTGKDPQKYKELKEKLHAKANDD